MDEASKDPCWLCVCTKHTPKMVLWISETKQNPYMLHEPWTELMVQDSDSDLTCLESFHIKNNKNNIDNSKGKH
jgi:hypothetical protein